jgi:hypothetical protein
MRSLRLCLVATLIGLLATTEGHGQQPQTPPVDKPPVIAPAVVPSTDDVPVVDPIQTPLTVNVAIRGAVQGDLIVVAPVGQLLELSLTGDGAADSGPVFWTYSEAIPDKSERDAGHWVGLTFPPEVSGKAYLIQAAVNGPEGKPPLVAMRWLIVSGKGPQPPPKPPVVVPDPPGPTPPVVDGKRSLVIVSESSKDKGEFSRLLINLRDGSAASYLKSKGHTFDWLDADQMKSDDPWREQFTAAELPVAFIIDTQTNTVLKKEPIAESTTADNLIEAVKRQGG